jgi:hypothetical protein
MPRLRMASCGSRSPQDASTTANRHVFPQSYFGGHGERQFHNRSLGKRRLREKKHSAAAQVLNKSGHRASLEMNRQRLMDFKALRRSPFYTSPFYTRIKTIGICAHGHPSLSRLAVDLNSIADRPAREVASRLPAQPVEIRTESQQRLRQSPGIFPPVARVSGSV